MARPALIDPDELERFLRQIWENAGEDGLDPAEQRAALVAFSAWHAQAAAFDLWRTGRLALAWNGNDLGLLLPEEEGNR